MRHVKKVKAFHIDTRGEMFYLVDEDVAINGVLLITSKKGSIRANHYHKRDSHYSYMVKGSMEYTYKSLDKKNVKPITVMVSQGEIVYTPPMTEHAMKFIEDSIFLAITTEKRNHKKYEDDLVRVELVHEK